ncbi:MAG: NADH-quinone oxidoreductase subunit A [Verrucomicrobiales bacterium]|nr:NADH-quinone oxidoreductase subunit A [Verrucomicrobiales bacterium]
MLDQYLPVLLQLSVATGFAVSTLIVSVLLGKSAKSNAIKDSAYECGMLPIGDDKPRFSVKFYVIAMLFVIFDIEVVFMYPWAVTFRSFLDSGQVAMVFWSMSGFVGILLVAYLYALKKGALSWKS